MSTILAYILCGAIAGVLGGYLGLGGGIVIVPFLTLIMGLDIKTAVPVSMAAIVVNSLASSSEYLKKDLVDLRLVVLLGICMIVGTAVGSSLLSIIPSDQIKLLFCVVLVYTGISLLKKNTSSDPSVTSDGYNRRLISVGILTGLGGIVAGLVGVGGGVIIIPLMFLVLGVPLSIARGTSSFIVGFAGATSVAVYLTNGLVSLAVVSPVMLGTILGGRLGGSLGALAKPKVVRIAFFVLLLYVAIRTGYGALKDLL
jgi:uncharacterized membrane protein YfcA